MLQPAAPGLLANMSQCKLILVNLSDMSEFIACVRNPGDDDDFLVISPLVHSESILKDPKRIKGIIMINSMYAINIYIWYLKYIHIHLQKGNISSHVSVSFCFGMFPSALASKEPLCVWNLRLKMQSSLHRWQSSTWDDGEQLGSGQWAQFGHYQPCLQRQGQAITCGQHIPVTFRCHQMWRLESPEKSRFQIHGGCSIATIDYRRVINMNNSGILPLNPAVYQNFPYFDYF